MTKYQPNSTGKCPNCLNSVRFELTVVETNVVGSNNTSAVFIDAPMQNDKEVERLVMTTASCPACGKIVLTIELRDSFYGKAQAKEYVVWPLRSARPVPKEVPAHIRADYEEAALVLNLSPKASAALSRRCLQAVLREEAGANQNNLVAQIEAVIPKRVSENLSK